MTEAVNILRSPVQTAVQDPVPGIVRNTGLPLQTALQTPTPAVNPASNNTVNNAVVSPRSEIGSGTRFSWPAPYTYKPWKRKDTWTHQFVCLSNAIARNVPNRSDKP